MNDYYLASLLHLLCLVVAMVQNILQRDNCLVYYGVVCNLE